MFKHLATTLNGPDGLIAVTCGEASLSQRVRCCKLAAASFSSPLSEIDYLEREEHLAQRPLTRNNGLRYWCLTLTDDPTQVLATCKTIHRDLLIRDAAGTRQEKSFCIASVVTDAKYRQLGLASVLLRYVCEWMDGPGDGAASMLYTSIGDFYVSRGWKKLPASQSTLSLPLNPFTFKDRKELPESKLLSSEDITALCELDVEYIKANLQNEPLGTEEILMAILPTPPLISWLHDRGDFISLKTNGQTPKWHGSHCVIGDFWLYWHHDFRKEQLAIQRVHNSRGQTGVEALASLLLVALEEAKRWDLPKVVIWDASQELLRATQLLKDMFGIEIESRERVKSITSLRLRGSDETRKIMVLNNEHYAWS